MPQSFKVPVTLKPGDSVRLVAPCGPVAAADFEAGVGWLRSLDLEPVYEPGVLSGEAYLAGPDARRASELVRALDDPKAKAIWAVRGGYGSTRLLPQLPPQMVRRHPKWLIGYSDVTALHALWHRAGVASLHGPTVGELGALTRDAGQRLRQLLFEGKFDPIPIQTEKLGGTLADNPRGSPRDNAGDNAGNNAGDNPGAASAHPVIRGALMGGNLALLAALVGTGFLPPFEDALVLLEDVNEPPYRLDRMLTQLMQAHAFRGAAAFVLGEFLGCGEKAKGEKAKGEKAKGNQALTVMRERLSPLGVPLVHGLPVGHGRGTWPVPLGVDLTLDLSAGSLRPSP